MIDTRPDYPPEFDEQSEDEYKEELRDLRKELAELREKLRCVQAARKNYGAEVNGCCADEYLSDLLTTIDAAREGE